MLGGPATAQYFGQNKVQYKRLQFQTLRTEHFDVYFTQSDRVAIESAARMAERWHERLSRVLLHRLMDRQPLILYSSHPEFEQTNVVPERIDESTGGFTEPAGRRIVMPLAGTLADTDHVIGHELVHAFQFDMTANLGETGGLGRLPLWFVEGLAEYCSLGPTDPTTAMWLRDAALRKALPTIDNLDDPAYFPYRWGHAYWAYVAGRWGDGIIRRLFVQAAESGVRAATQSVLGRSTATLTQEWHAAIEQAYAPTLAAASTAEPGARVPLGGSRLGSDLNVGPAISPDGRKIAFLSGRGIFSIDLYVADTATGRIERKLTNTSANPHFSSLQFIQSAGAWDRDGRRLVVAAVTGGRAALAIFDTRTWRQEGDIVVPDIDEIFNPSWSPDGRFLCFTGMRRGVTDLYVYDISTATTRRLTDDAFADLQPAWSPDGRRIAFATDRFTSALDTFAAGRYRLALIDVESLSIEPLRASRTGDDINPQWSPDGQTVYFVSNRTGIPNIYRVPADGGEVVQVTDVATGVSGITRSSPSMSIAAQQGNLSFSVFGNGGYDIYVLNPSGRQGVMTEAAPNSATLPPIDRKPSEIAGLIDNPGQGLPLQAAAHAVTRYTSSLSLEHIGGAVIAAGSNPFGAVAQGAAMFSFADTLGDRRLAFAVQPRTVTNTFSASDLAAQVAYVNQSRRWNWAAAAGQIPFVNGVVQYEGGEASSPGAVGVSETILFRRIERNASLVAAYPFNHAARLEIVGSANQFSFDRVTETMTYSMQSGEMLRSERNTTTLAPPLLLGTGGAALVFDTTNNGATSPVSGQRYRLEVAPTAGTIYYTNVLADYRRYLMPAPFYTIAVRLLHAGRYGSGSEDPRLLPSYVGHPSLVRGYDSIPLDSADCVAIGVLPCSISNPLIGSRVLVGNIEFRMPLLRPFGVSRRMYGPVPTELAIFADAGSAWNRGERPSFSGGSRPPAASAGFTVRTNLRGLAIAAVNVARPLEGRDKGWVFQFNLSPGF
jgi:hypothetical protein